MIIYILEDDLDQSALLKLWIEEQGHQSELFDNGRTLIERLQVAKPDLAILDWNLPILNGLDVMRWMKSNGLGDVPIIFNSVRNSEEEVVNALSLGADDYLIKPIRQAELMARITAVMRRVEPNREDRQTDSRPYEFVETKHQVKFNGKTVDLTDKEFHLACYLFGNHNTIVSREVLLESIWSKSASLSTRTVDTHISRLRKKLELDGNTGWKLTSVYHKGYRLVKLEE